MTWGTADEPATKIEEIPTADAPVWILLIALLSGVLGFAASVFYGLGGAVAGYVLGLAAFSCILVFRRRYGVLSQTSYVNEPAGLNALVVGTFIFTAVEIVIAVWPIATEVSRR